MGRAAQGWAGTGREARGCGAAAKVMEAMVREAATRAAAVLKEAATAAMPRVAAAGYPGLVVEEAVTAVAAVRETVAVTAATPR